MARFSENTELLSQKPVKKRDFRNSTGLHGKDEYRNLIWVYQTAAEKTYG